MRSGPCADDMESIANRLDLMPPPGVFCCCSMSLPKPPDYKPPGLPTIRDVARTLRCLATDVPRELGLIALGSNPGSSTTDEGLAVIRARYLRVLARLGITLEVLHTERVPRQGGLVLMTNQESHLEHLVITALPRPFLAFYNNEVARIPLYGPHIKRSGHIHIDRTNEAQWRRCLTEAAERARQGAVLLLSPEGTRSWDGKLLPLKRGGFILAAASERPIVCIAMIGSHQRLPRGSWIVRGGRFRIVFSEPIATIGRSEEELRAEVARVLTELKERHRLD